MRQKLNINKSISFYNDLLFAYNGTFEMNWWFINTKESALAGEQKSGRCVQIILDIYLGEKAADETYIGLKVGEEEVKTNEKVNILT